jgi:peptidoglycan/LPS O-acetylase OafA/YrhL
MTPLLSVSKTSPKRAPVLESSRDLPLEALRGLAALVVVVWHFFLGLDPLVLNLPGLRGTPFFAFVHGSAAVGVFFVLSGYVLTRHYFETGQKRVLVIGALKRWFRLFLPVFLSVMLSWFFFHFDLYAYKDAAAISRSNWLMSFGFAMNTPFEPNFLGAIQNGFSESIYHDANAYNPLLWTIHIELMGSYIAFAFAGLVRSLRNHNWMIALALFLVGLSTHFVEPWLIAFLAGTLLAFHAPKLKSLKTTTGIVYLVLGITFLGYDEPVGFYGFLDFLEPINGETLRSYTSTIGAVFIMMSFIGYEALRRHLQGRAARLLGRLSFPIYLVHLILIFSLGSIVFVLAKDSNGYSAALAIAALALAPAILALAGLFAAIDIKWIAFVNSLFRRIKIAD